MFGRTLARPLAVENAARTKAALRMFLVRGLGLRSANVLIKHFKDIAPVFDAKCSELEALGLPPEVADDLLSTRSTDRADREWDRAVQLGVDIVDILDPPLYTRETLGFGPSTGRDRGHPQAHGIWP
jgi:hypothetical protein